MILSGNKILILWVEENFSCKKGKYSPVGGGNGSLLVVWEYLRLFENALIFLWH